MKNTRLWTVLFAAALLCACLAGVLFMGASAADEAVEWSVGTDGDYATVEAALAAAEERDWAQDEKLVLNLTGSHTATVVDGVLFGQKTIWRRLDADGNATVYGNKLPITIKGGGMDIATSATVAACANDYTFDGVTLNWANNTLRFFAGCGQITLKDSALGSVPSKWTTRKFYIFGDNNTANVYEGWTEADLDAVMQVEEGDDKATLTTSITLDNTSYPGLGGGGYFPRMGAKGSTTAWTATIGTKTLKPSDTKAAFIFGNGATVGRVGGIVTEGEGTWVDEAIIKMLPGGIANAGGIVGDSGSQSTGNDFGTDVEENYEGDISVYLLSGTITGTSTVGFRALTSSSLKGNVYVEADDITMTYTTSAEPSKILFQLCYGACNVDGDIIANIKGGEYSDVYGGVGGGGTCTGKLELNISGGTMGGVYANQGHKVKEVTNTITGGTITTFYGKNNNGSETNIKEIKKVTNIIKDDGILDANGKDGPTITNFYGGGNRYGATDFEIENEVSGSATITNFYGGMVQSASYINPVKTVTNTIDLSKDGSIAVFYGGSGGTATKNGTTVGTVKNIIKNGKIDCFRGGSTVGPVSNIINEISGGTFLYTFSGGSGDTIEKIKNEISGGAFNGIKGDSSSSNNHYSAFLGVYGTTTGSVTGGIENIITGGTFKAYSFGGSYEKTISNSDGPAIKNDIRGGTFHGFWCANSGGNDRITGEILNEISGGNFEGYVTGGALYNKSFGGGNRNRGNGNASITNRISGGTFAHNVCFADYPHGTTYNGTGLTGEVNTTISGGVFNGKIYTNTFEGTEVNLFPTATLTIATEEGKALEIYGEISDCTSFKTETESVKIGEKTYINAKSVVGTVKLHQTEGWLSNEYFVAPAGTEFSVTAENGIFGSYEEKIETDAVILRGVDMTRVYGASLILDERLNVRILIDSEGMETNKDYFTFAASINGENLSVEAEEYTYEGVTYDSYIIKALTLAQFTETVKVVGDTFADFAFSVVSLAESGAENSADGSAAEKLFQSIANLGTYVNDSEAELKYALDVLDVPAHNNDASRTEGVTDVVLTTKTLIMSNAVGIRLAGTGAVDATTVKVYVNELDVTELCAFAAEEGTFTIDLYVNAARLTSNLKVKVTNVPAEGEAEIVYLEYTERMDAFAKAVWDAGHESAKHCLIFIQAVEAYKNA